MTRCDSIRFGQFILLEKEKQIKETKERLTSSVPHLLLHLLLIIVCQSLITIQEWSRQGIFDRQLALFSLRISCSPFNVCPKEGDLRVQQTRLSIESLDLFKWQLYCQRRMLEKKSQRQRFESHRRQIT